MSSFNGSNPSALNATSKSFTSILPFPFVSNKSKASFTSNFYASVNSFLYPLTFAFFFPGPTPAEAPPDLSFGNGAIGAGFVFDCYRFRKINLIQNLQIIHFYLFKS